MRQFHLGKDSEQMPVSLEEIIDEQSQRAHRLHLTKDDEKMPGSLKEILDEQLKRSSKRILGQ